MKQEFILRGAQEARLLFGDHDYNLKTIEKTFKVKIMARGDNLSITGDEKSLGKANKIIKHLLDVIRSNKIIKRHEVDYLIKKTDEDPGLSLSSIYSDKIEVPSKKQFIYPKTNGQKLYVDAMKAFDIVISIGPAGTGKTYLAMAMAVSALMNNIVNRIILTRPAIEAGEKLGFLPGDLYDKVTPYLRPLYDALYEMMEPDHIHNHIENGIIEVAPLAYMRGRTLNDSFIIMDEAQNATREQMKMFLTRLGFDSKVVITGDVTQSDLPNVDNSGLSHIRDILKEIKGIKFIMLDGTDVVRHALVQQIIGAYERASRKA
ncbi:MAG: PhoH family protein [Candidatus Omnitrophota bacterium]